MQLVFARISVSGPVYNHDITWLQDGCQIHSDIGPLGTDLQKKALTHFPVQTPEWALSAHCGNFTCEDLFTLKTMFHAHT